MLDDPHVGERDPRTEDRQLLLDALMAASDRLIVTYTGNDERTNIAPPARGAGRRAAGRGRPHGAHADGAAREASSCATRCSRSTRATSRPASSCAERAVELRPRDARRRARRWPASAPQPRAVPAPSRCPPLAAPVVELEDLVRFVEHPVRRVPAPAARDQRRRRRRRGRGRAAGRARRPRALERRPAAARGAARGRRATDGDPRPRSRAARCRRACSASR